MLAAAEGDVAVLLLALGPELGGVGRDAGVAPGDAHREEQHRPLGDENVAIFDGAVGLARDRRGGVEAEILLDHLGAEIEVAHE